MEGDDLEDILNPYKSHTCKMGTHLPNPADISNLESHLQGRNISFQKGADKIFSP